MLNLTDHLRRLRVDKYEYVAMKVIVLLQSGMQLFPFFERTEMLMFFVIPFRHRHI